MTEKMCIILHTVQFNPCMQFFAEQEKEKNEVKCGTKRKSGGNQEDMQIEKERVVHISLLEKKGYFSLIKVGNSKW